MIACRRKTLLHQNLRLNFPGVSSPILPLITLTNLKHSLALFLSIPRFQIGSSHFSAEIQHASAAQRLCTSSAHYTSQHTKMEHFGPISAAFNHIAHICPICAPILLTSCPNTSFFSLLTKPPSFIFAKSDQYEPKNLKFGQGFALLPQPHPWSLPSQGESLRERRGFGRSRAPP